MTAQSNYAAGNNFQDAFSHAYSAAYPHTRYITLDLGAIDGSDSITLLPIRRAELERQSAIFMTFDELFVALEYAMGTQAEIDGATRKSKQPIHLTILASRVGMRICHEAAMSLFL